MKNALLKEYLPSVSIKTQNQLKGCLEDKILYYHIPKCGGTSIRKALKSCYLDWDPRNQSHLFILNAGASFHAAQKSVDQNLSIDTADDYSVLKLRESLLLYNLYQSKIKFISGHFAFSETAYQSFSDQYSCITILRDPVERWISSYFFNTFKKDDHRKIRLEIDEYLQSDFSRAQGYEYAKFLGGINPTSDYSSAQAIDRAKENLQKFRLVGFLEYMDIFVQNFEKTFGRRLTIEALNKNPKQSGFRDSIITAEVREKIEELCKPDVEIYQYAMKKYLNAS